ncbi:hypothetical protein CMI48_02825 [Candidatus Pacearchaeota archaeon]|nr:hypothetical protein [Candidatus Pacearchaeota archaeon]
MKDTYFIEEYKTEVPGELDKWRVAFPPKIVELFVEEYSGKGDVVFDPFAGFGTTVSVAKKMGRESFGCEIDQAKICFAKEKLDVELIGKSVFDLDHSEYPKIDLCLFSPPYWGPALGAKTYHGYLNKLEKLSKKIETRMNEGAHLIVFVQNYKFDRKGLLTLAWDLGNVLKNHFYFEQDFIWCVDRTKSKRDMKHEAADHHYCLVFRKK